VLRTLTGAARTFVCQEAPTRPAVVSQMGSKESSLAPSGVAGKRIEWSGRRRAAYAFFSDSWSSLFRSKRVGIAASSTSDGTNR
jgi:hypothetical protein